MADEKETSEFQKMSVEEIVALMDDAQAFLSNKEGKSVLQLPIPEEASNEDTPYRSRQNESDKWWGQQALLHEAELGAAQELCEEAAAYLRSAESQIQKRLAEVCSIRVEAELAFYKVQKALVAAENDLLEAQKLDLDDESTKIYFSRWTAAALAKKELKAAQQEREKMDFFFLLTSVQAIEQWKIAHEFQTNAHTMLQITQANAYNLLQTTVTPGVGITKPERRQSRIRSTTENRVRSATATAEALVITEESEFGETLRRAVSELESSRKMAQMKLKAKMWTVEKAKADAETHLLLCKQEAAPKIEQAKKMQRDAEKDYQDYLKMTKEAEISGCTENATKASTALLAVKEARMRLAFLLRLYRGQVKIQVDASKKRQDDAHVTLFNAQQRFSLSDAQSEFQLEDTPDIVLEAKCAHKRAEFHYSFFKSQAENLVCGLQAICAKAESNLSTHQKAKADIEGQLLLAEGLLRYHVLHAKQEIEDVLCIDEQSEQLSRVKSDQIIEMFFASKKNLLGLNADVPSGSSQAQEENLSASLTTSKDLLIMTEPADNISRNSTQGNQFGLTLLKPNQISEILEGSHEK